MSGYSQCGGGYLEAVLREHQANLRAQTGRWISAMLGHEDDWREFEVIRAIMLVMLEGSPHVLHEQSLD